MCAHRGQAGASVAIKLESQAVVKHPMWVLGAEVGPSAKAMCTLTSRGISAAPALLFLAQALRYCSFHL